VLSIPISAAWNAVTDAIGRESGEIEREKGSVAADVSTGTRVGDRQRFRGFQDMARGAADFDSSKTGKWIIYVHDRRENSDCGR
jgi:hypothetical protein